MKNQFPGKGKIKTIKTTFILILLLMLILSITGAAQANASPSPALDAGAWHNLLLREDGTVWAWGWDDDGQLGRGSWRFAGIFGRDYTPGQTPMQVQGLSGIRAVAGGNLHSLALKNDGTVWSWGSDAGMQLGAQRESINPEYSQYYAGQVKSISGVQAVAAGSYHSVVLKQDGTVWGWGSNSSGQRGDGSTPERLPFTKETPVQALGLRGVTAIAAGSNHTLALRNDGTVWAWGADIFLQNPDGSRERGIVPLQIPNLSGITAVDGGTFHSLALKNDGTVWSWGTNTSGQLGDGTGNTALPGQPVQILGLSGITAISAGGFHNLALDRNGSVWAWGANIYGQLGNGITTNSNVPVPVQGLSGVADIAAGNNHSAALGQDGTVWAWGSNARGELGLEMETRQSLTPVQSRISSAASPLQIVLQVDNSVAKVGDLDVPLDVPPFISGGRTLVPLRFIGEQLGAKIGWEGQEQKVTYTRGTDEVILWVGRSNAMVNGKQTPLDVPPQIRNGRTMVPLRFISNAFGAKTDWDSVTRSITITP